VTDDLQLARFLMLTRLLLRSSALVILSASSAAVQSPPPALGELWSQVEIVRTAHGVPHIRAETIRRYRPGER